MLVSVGMPVYNGGDEFRRALECILNQIHADLEIIISDNCSTDGTGEYCRSIADTDSRVRYIQQDENIGGEANIAYVLDQAVGDYFFWAAADDVRSDNFVEQNLQFLTEHPDYVASTCPIRFEDGEFSSAAMGDGELDESVEQRMLHVLRYWHTNGRFYSLYRTGVLRDCFVRERYLGSDFSTTFAMVMRGKYHRTEEGFLHLGSGGTSRQEDSFYASYRGNSRIRYYLPFYDLARFVLRLTKSFPLSKRFRILKRLLEWNGAVFQRQFPTKYKSKTEPEVLNEESTERTAYRRARRAKIKRFIARLK